MSKTPEGRDILRYLDYCRTRYVAPQSWSFYWRRFGPLAAFGARRRHQHRAEAWALRTFPMRSRRRLPFEFIRLDPWEMPALYMAAERAQRGIVEIGRYHGGSTFVLCLANRKVPVWSIDVAPQEDARLERLLAQEGIGANAHILVGDSQHGSYPQIEPGSYDLLFIDGDHSFAGCLADIEFWWPGLAPGGSVLLHDCYQGSEVQAAVTDFVARHEAAIEVRGADVHPLHWHTELGSLGHLRKA